MKRVNALLRRIGVLTLLGVSMAGLAMSTPAYAGEVHLSIGLGIPLPVEVVPAPVVVASPPVIVWPASVIAHPYPVVIAEPYIVHHHHLPPGLAKKYYGKHPKHHW